MKNSLFILVVLLSWCLIDTTGGVVIHSRRAGWCPRVCHSVCHFACPTCHKECDTVCEDACRRKKSGVRTLSINERVHFFGIFLFPIYILISLTQDLQLPCAFAAWDKNGDNLVDFEEFSSVAYPFFNKRHLSLVFQSIDTDSMSKILKSKGKKQTKRF